MCNNTCRKYQLRMSNQSINQSWQCWQAATVLGYLGGRTFWLLGIKCKAYLLPLMVSYVNEVRI